MGTATGGEPDSIEQGLPFAEGDRASDTGTPITPPQDRAPVRRPSVPRSRDS